MHPKPPGPRQVSTATAAALSARESLTVLDLRARKAGGTTELATSAEAGPDILHYLACHGGAATRAAVAANSKTWAKTNRLLANDEDEEVRAELALKIARLMPGLSQSETSHVLALTIETLECLAQDSAVKVRAILAEQVKSLDCIPHGVALRLAHDAESIVAAPILEYSPLLSDTDLMEIIACAQVSERLSAIARRRPLSEKVSDCIIQALDVSAISTLLINNDARIRKQTMDKIIDQAREISVLQEPLALRADLSARAIRRIAELVGSSILEKLAARHDLSQAMRSHLNKALRARLAQSAPPTGYSPAEIVENARRENRLDAAFVEQACDVGQRELVVLALTSLARVSEETVRKILGATSAKPIVSLVWYAHLSMRVAYKIQTFIMKLPGHTTLPAHGGTAFPLSKEEMRWYLAYFNIST